MKLLFEAKFKTDVDNPALESRVDRKMVEDMIIGDGMMVEENSANKDPDDCGEFSVFDGIVVGGGVVPGDYGRIIYERTQDFQHIDLMTQEMNGTRAILKILWDWHQD